VIVVSHDERMIGVIDRIYQMIEGRIISHLSRQSGKRKEIKCMPDWSWFIAAFVVYIVSVRWVLPRFGVPA
jgi:hypothetical protein